MEILTKNSKKLYQNYKSRIIDILVFGSAIKGKFEPRDIDIAIILKNTKEQELPDLIQEFNEYFDKKNHLNLMLIENIFENLLFKTLINEGISLITNKPLHQKIGYDSKAIFSLNLTKLKKSKKVLFSYALHGKKDMKGMLKSTNGKEIGRAVLLIPIQQADNFKEFLENWNVDFYMMKILKEI